MTCRAALASACEESTNARRRKLLVFGIMAAVAVAPAAELASQDGWITGIVVDFSSGEPLPGVRVTMIGNSLPEAAISGADGVFRLRGAPTGESMIRFARDGYVTETETLDVRPGENPQLEVYLTRVDAILEELRVSVPASTAGVASEGTQRIQLQIPTTGGTVADLLRSNVPGLSIDAPADINAPVGRVRIRGSRSLALSGSPVIFVNGVRVGGRSMDVLREIPLSTVSSVEVLKGAAAMSYGLDSINGVILIRTR